MASTKELFFQNQAQTTDFPLALEMARAKGNYIYDTSEKKYLDLISGISVSNVGHGHPKVISAIQNQINKHMHLMVYGEFIQTQQALLSHKIAKHLPNPLESVYLVNSGSEALEGAMKLAKRFTGRPEIIHLDKSYHGSTNGALSVIGEATFQNGFRPLIPGIRKMEPNNLESLDKINSKTAAVIVEPIQGEAGYKPLEVAFFQKLRKKCTELGTLLIVDEIQTGFGRTGKLFAFEHYNIVPDIVLLAKGLGGGMPIGAFVSSKKIMDTLKQNPILGHITTFGGHPVSAAAANATIDVILEEDLISKVPSKEKLFRSLLIHPKILNVTGKGLMLGVELKDFESVEIVINHCIDKGVITDWFLFNSNSLRIAPPLPISEDEIEFACRIILEGLNKL